MWEIFNKQRKAAVTAAQVNSFSQTKSTEKEIPECININFREDYNIHSLHEIVKFKIDKESKLTFLYDSFILAEQLRSIMSPDQPNKINEYVAEKKRLCDPQRLNEYIEKANMLLSQYDKIPKPRYDGNNSVYYPNEVDLERIDVILKYINLASRYINIRYTCTGQNPSNSQTLCYNCGNDLKTELDEKLFVESCSMCGFRCNIKKYVPKLKKENLNSNVSASTCNELGNFLKAINYYQGKVVLTKYKIEDIKCALDSYFTEKKLPIGDEIIRSAPLNDKGQREGTDVQMMIRAMKDKRIDCYSHINYICREYWKWKLRDISHLEGLLIDDFNKTQEHRNHLTIDERGGLSNIPVNLRLYLHLVIRGWDCSMNDFKLSSDAEKYIPGFKKMCMMSGDSLLIEGCKKF